MRFRLVAIQDAAGQGIAARLGIDAAAPQTNAVALDGRAFFKSDAALAVLRHLPGWRWTVVLRAVPRTLRDRIYDRVARNRYRFFGSADACLVPTPDLAARFLKAGPPAA